jgi:F-type H+-transporting ATPase subunit epsilon
MNSFRLKIVTPYGLVYDGEAQQLIVRTITGDFGILAGHSNCVAPLGMGQASVIIDGQRRTAACIGGMLSMVDGVATLVPTTFEWAEDIDYARADAAEARARNALSDKTASKNEIRLAEARLKRALVRKNVAAQGRGK